MKTLILALALTFIAAIGVAQKPTDDFSGKWLSEDKSVVTIKKEGGYFVGYDDKGNKVLYDIHFEDDGWIGRGRDPFTGISGSCEVSFDGNRLKLRGGLGFIKTNHYFTRQY